MSEVLVWPEVPICHADIPSVFAYSDQKIHWRVPRMGDGPYDQPWRTCSYCGSIHPEDLLRIANEGAVITMADWKYGWPHKFYVDNIPNPAEGQLRVSGGVSVGGRGMTLEEAKAKHPDPTLANWRSNDSGGWKADSITPAPKYTHAKWYNEHLTELKPTAFAAMSSMLLAKTGVAFQMKGNRLGYCCGQPH